MSVPTFVVLLLITVYVAYHIQRSVRTSTCDNAIAREHGCLLAPRLQNQSPMGIDRLKQIFRAHTEHRLMELFLFHFNQTGYTLEQKFLGTRAFATIEPANLEAILSTKFKDFSMGLRRAITFPLFGEGIFTQEGTAWKHSRDLLRPQLQYRQYESLEIFRDSADDLLAIMASSDKGVVDLQPLFFRLTLDVTTEFLFGESVKSLKAPKTTGEQSFAEAFNIAQEYVAKRFRLLDMYWLIGGRKFKKACADVQTFADQIIDRNLSSERSKESHFLAVIARSTASRDELRGQIINLLAAGRDTTACLLTWTFFLLVRHPNVLSKLREEISEHCGNVESLTRNSLRTMEYLQVVLKEALRLYPSVPVNTRTATETTVLPTGGGPNRTAPVLIPKGSAVAYSVYSLHRRPDLYGMDALLFRPERWQEDMPMYKDKTTATWGYLPFNGGPRICLGMDFALTEAAYITDRILQRFPNLSLPASTPITCTGSEKQTMTIVVASTEGCRVNLT